MHLQHQKLGVIENFLMLNDEKLKQKFLDQGKLEKGLSISTGVGG